MKKVVSILLVVLFAMSLLLTGCAEKETVIKITHKDYTEQRITGQLLSVYLESKGFATEVTELSGTMLCYTALKNDDVDMYAEFTGSAYAAVFDQTEIIGEQATYDYVKEMSETTDGITWLKPLGWNNTYVLSVRAETAEEFNLKTVEDLIAVAPDMIMGCDDEFQNRADGLPGLQEAYAGLEFADVVSMDQGLTYTALNNGDIDVNVSYSTDGRIAKLGLINLEDSKKFFPPYYVTPILKMEFAEANPEVVAALNELGGHWTTDEEMQKYNLMVDEGESTVDVATMMLEDAGLI